MKVMVIVKATRASEAGEMPGSELLAAMGRFNEELAKAGILVDAAGLKPSSAGARVLFSGESRTVVDGPFIETNELIAGYWLWNVKSLTEAVDWVKKCPNPMTEDSDIEIRPLFGPEDFGESFTPELREQEAAVRARTLGLNPPTFRDGPTLSLAGVSRSYTRETRSGIPAQWEGFVARAGEISGGASTFYGVCWNSKPDCSFDYLTAVERPSGGALPPGVTSLTLAPSRYAVFDHTGHVSALPETIDTIWAKWAPGCGLSLADAPCFERYTPEYDGRTGTGGMEVWIPLRS